jgi:hypothetical protein
MFGRAKTVEEIPDGPGLDQEYMRRLRQHNARKISDKVAWLKLWDTTNARHWEKIYRTRYYNILDTLDAKKSTNL